jgi:hypothetical protein
MDARSYCNISVLSGVVTDVTIRLLASGDRLATFGVRVPGPGARATSVPVVVFDPPAWLDRVDDDLEVVVIGAAQRRFFKLGTGLTGSNTEVVAQAVLRATDRRRIATALRRASAILEDLAA